MFDFSKLALDRRNDPNNHSSFVGIMKNTDGIFEFRLPVGFSDFPEADYQSTKNLFFSMYKTFRKFEEQHKGKYLDDIPRSKDSATTSGSAYSFLDKNDDEVLLYSKISTIDNILSTYDDLMINTIIRTEGNTEHVNFDKIEGYLDKAIYIDDVIYIDEYESTKNTLDYSIHSIIELYSFILCEIKKELQEEVSVEIRNYYNSFRELHLSHEDSLFSEDTFESTISILKDVLDKIDRVTAYKDSGYWEIYTAIEIFLYGDFNSEKTNDDGIFWGINNFYQIWEDMCNVYSFTTFKEEISYADTNIKINGKIVSNKKIGSKNLYCLDSFDAPFYLEMNSKKRYARPDLIRKVKPRIKFEIIKEHKLFGKKFVDLRIKNEEPEKKYFNFVIDQAKKIVNRKRNNARYKKPNIFTTYPFEEYINLKNILI